MLLSQKEKKKDRLNLQMSCLFSFTQHSIVFPGVVAFLWQVLLHLAIHEFHETCHSVTFIVLVNSHQR